MEYNKLIPEGWEDNFKKFSIDDVKKAAESGDTIQGMVVKCDSNYNLYVNLGDGIQGIIPRDEIEAINIDESGIPKPNICKSKVNKVVQFKVKGINNNDVAILSRKDVGKEAIQWLKNDLKEGKVVDGIVKNIRPYGAFIEIGGGLVGLLHIEDISVARIKTPEERFQIGQKVKVMIKSIDRKNNRVILSHKELLGSWEENVKEFQEGTIVKAIARENEKSNNGIFIELKPNLVGMAEYKENVDYGQEVEVYIKKILPDKKKIKLIIK